MNENFGNIGLGSFPPGYGECSNVGVVPASQDLPSPQDGAGEYGWTPGENLRKWFSKDDSDDSTGEEGTEEVESSEEERSSFWKNLTSSFSPSEEEGEASQSAADTGRAIGAGAAGFVEQTLPTFLQLFGPQVEEQEVELIDTTPEIQQAGFPWKPVLAVAAVGGVGYLIYKKTQS